MVSSRRFLGCLGIALFVGACNAVLGISPGQPRDNASVGGAGGTSATGGASCEAMGVSCTTQTWPEVTAGGTTVGEIFYEYGGDWSLSERMQIENAMEQWKAATYWMIRFKPSGTEPNRIVLQHGDEPRCRAEDIGMRGGVQTVYAWSGHCSQVEQVRVLGNVIGLRLQHTRPDRDRYVELDAARLCGSDSSSNRYPDQSDLVFCSSGNAATFGPYNLHSVMEYAEPFPEGCTPEGPVTCAIRARDGSPVLPASGVTPEDASAVIELYLEWQPRQPPFAPFVPVVSADPGPTEPLDLRLAPGVSIRGAPALSYQREDVMDAFALGEDGHIYYKPYRGSWATGYYTDLGGDFEAAGDKVVASASAGLGEIEVVARSAGGLLRYRRCTGGTVLAPCQWEAAWSDPLEPPADGDTSGPALIASPDGRVDLFIRFDHELYQRTWTNGTWTYWLRHDGAIALTPAVSAYGGMAHVVAATPDGGLVGKSGDPANLIAAQWAVVNPPAPANTDVRISVLASGTSPAVSYDGGTLAILYQAVGGMLAIKWIPLASGVPVWHPYGTRFGGLLDSSPAAVQWPAETHTDGVLRVVANIQGGLWHRSSTTFQQR